MAVIRMPSVSIRFCASEWIADEICGFAGFHGYPRHGCAVKTALFPFVPSSMVLYRCCLATLVGLCNSVHLTIYNV
jgi:hypothetical protein